MRLKSIWALGLGLNFLGLVTATFVLSFYLWGFKVSPVWVVPTAVFFVASEVTMSVYKRRLDEQRIYWDD